MQSGITLRDRIRDWIPACSGMTGCDYRILFAASAGRADGVATKYDFLTRLEDGLALLASGVLQLRHRRPGTGAGAVYGVRNLLKVGRGQLDGPGIDPAVDLLR